MKKDFVIYKKIHNQKLAGNFVEGIIESTYRFMLKEKVDLI